jgi:hypothetical protein
MVMKSDIQSLREDGPEPATPMFPTVTLSIRPVGHARRRDDAQFDVVWSGIGPLPGAGGAAGLGSTLSGIHFSIGRRR